jgi:Na+/proline symporter
VGLSAVATNNSGYMFIGVIGYTYATGLASAWLMVGWIAGDFLASLFIHKQLRNATANSGEVSYAGVLSHWHGQKIRYYNALLVASPSRFYWLTPARKWLPAVKRCMFYSIGRCGPVPSRVR